MKSFLEPLNLAPYRALLKEQGFDDPDDFGNMSASDVDTMAAALSAGGMKPGHVLKLSRTINELRKPAGEPSTPPAVSWSSCCGCRSRSTSGPSCPHLTRPWLA